MGKIITAIVAFVLLSTSTYAVADNPQPSGYFINTDLVVQLVCTEIKPNTKGGHDQYTGTAFFVGTHTLMTADHVVAGMTCTIDGKTVQITEEDQGLDYAIVTTPTSTKEPEEVLNYSCDGYKKDQEYLAVGFALGQDKVVQSLRASSSHDDQDGFESEALLVGKTFEGMSGGPIFDQRGYVVGIVNGGDKEGRASVASRELRQTSICKK